MPFLLLALLPSADAKDLNGRLGVGFHQQFGDTSSLSVRYGLPTGSPTVNLHVEADVGLALDPVAGNGYFAGGRLLYGVVAEDNMNLYLAAGAGWVGGPDVLRVQPALAAEFFLFGLENLGFSAEWGVNVDLGADSKVTTVGAGPAAAVHYYF